MTYKDVFVYLTAGMGVGLVCWTILTWFVSSATGEAMRDLTAFEALLFTFIGTGVMARALIGR